MCNSRLHRQQQDPGACAIDIARVACLVSTYLMQTLRQQEIQRRRTSWLRSASALSMLRFDGEADPCRGPGSGESPRAPTLWERTMGLLVLSAAALAELC